MIKRNLRNRRGKSVKKGKRREKGNMRRNQTARPLIQTLLKRTGKKRRGRKNQRKLKKPSMFNNFVRSMLRCNRVGEFSLYRCLFLIMFT